MDANKARVAWICALWLVLALECALATKGPRRPKWHDEVAFLCVHNGAALKSNGLENLSTPFPHLQAAIDWDDWGTHPPFLNIPV